MTLQTDLGCLAFYLHDLAAFLQFSKARRKMPAEIQQLCRCSAFSKISLKLHYLYYVRILVPDLLRNFPAHICILIPHHITFLLKAKDKVLSTFFSSSDAAEEDSSYLLWKASKLLEKNLAERLQVSAHAMIWNFVCEWLELVIWIKENLNMWIWGILVPWKILFINYSVLYSSHSYSFAIKLFFFCWYNREYSILTGIT